MGRIKGLFEWLQIFISIFRGRSLTTYGKNHIKFIFEKFKYEFLYSLKDLDAAEYSIKKFVDLFEIKNLGPLIRIGPKYDAGYVALDLFPTPYLLSAGAGKNIDFEIFLQGEDLELICMTQLLRACQPLTKTLNILNTHLKEKIQIYLSTL